MVTRTTSLKHVEVLKLAGMGYTMSSQQFASGTLYLSVDTHGDFRRKATDTEWKQLLRVTNWAGRFPATNDPPEQSTGTYAIKFCPANELIGYRAWNGTMAKSTDGGDTWTSINFAATPVTSIPGNTSSETRLCQQKMEVHPTDPNEFYIGTLEHGLRYSTDGGNNVLTEANVLAARNISRTGGVPDGAAGSELQFLDRIVSTDTSNPNYAKIQVDDPGICLIYATATLKFAYSLGRGWFTKVGAAAWAAMALPAQMSLSYYVTDMAYDPVTSELVAVVRPWIAGRPSGSASKVIKWNGTAWSQVTLPTQGNLYHNVDIQGARWLVSYQDGRFVISEDRGATWSAIQTLPQNVVSPNIPVHEFSSNGKNFLAVADMNFSRKTGEADKIYMTLGVGIFSTFMTGNPSTITWASETEGIEQLVAQSALGLTNGEFAMTCQDRNLYKRSLSQFRFYPSVYYGNGGRDLSHAGGVHESAGIAGLITNAGQNANATTPGITNRSTAFWEGPNFVASETFPLKTVADVALPGGLPGYGEYFRTTGTKALLAPTNAGELKYSADGLAGPFVSVTLPHPDGPGGVITVWSGLNNAYYYLKNTMTQSWITPSKVWVHIGAEGSNPGGVWLHTSGGGDTGWTLKLNGSISGNGFFYTKLRAMHYQASWNITPRDWLYYCNGGGTTVGDTFGPMKYSSDDGATWTILPGVEEARDFEFGAPAPGSDWPTIWVIGRVKADADPSGVWGVHYTTDNGQSWMTVTPTYPMESPDDIASIGASKRDFGVAIIGWHGSGFAFITPAAEGSRFLRSAA